MAILASAGGTASATFLLAAGAAAIAARFDFEFSLVSDGLALIAFAAWRASERTAAESWLELIVGRSSVRPSPVGAVLATEEWGIPAAELEVVLEAFERLAKEENEPPSSRLSSEGTSEDMQ